MENVCLQAKYFNWNVQQNLSKSAHQLLQYLVLQISVTNTIPNMKNNLEALTFGTES